MQLVNPSIIDHASWTVPVFNVQHEFLYKQRRNKSNNNNNNTVQDLLLWSTYAVYVHGMAAAIQLHAFRSSLTGQLSPSHPPMSLLQIAYAQTAAGHRLHLVLSLVVGRSSCVGYPAVISQAAWAENTGRTTGDGIVRACSLGHF